MRIKKLELFGFKSFKDRTVIQFDEGITGVVGPNGCGKSNIVDALVWVMGEMSAKHLRGSSMEDVIFAGAEGYSPMGMAEVSLVLENDGGPFPTQYSRFSEIMVTRRLQRSGESEYLINKEPVRLRDVQEIFMDTGAGSKGFSIIEQGAIGKIITSKPEDRRVLIEEAAGITKFKVRKRESQRKLEATDQNLVRLQDILGEQKRQIDSLERQAQRAERYRKIKNELREKDLWLSSQNYLKLHAEALESERVFSEARDLDVGSEGRLSELEMQVSALRLQLAEKDAQVQTRQADHRQLLHFVQEMEFRIRELNMSIEQARRSNELTGSMVAQYNLRRQNLENEKENLEIKSTEALEAFALLDQDYNAKDSVFKAQQERISQADKELSDKRREMLTVQAGQSHLEARDSVLHSKIEEENKKLNLANQAVQELTVKRSEFHSRRNKVYGQLEQERQLQLDLTRDADLIENNLREVRTQLETRRNEVDAFKDELNHVASRLYGLENMQSNFEGFEEGVKNVMLWQRSRGDNSSAFKPFADLIEVPARYEMAMEAALGSRLQLLLSESKDGSMGAVDYLKVQKSGRSSFLSGDMAVETTTARADNEQLKIEPGVDMFLQDIVQIPENIRPQVATFFSDIVIVDSVRTALRLRTLYPQRTFVTHEGDVLSVDGVLTGGATESVESGVLKRRREIKELSLRREEVAGKVQLSQLSLKKLQDQEVGVQQQLEEAKKTAVEKEILITELRKDLERAEIELGNANSAYEREIRGSEQVASTLEQLQSTLAELKIQIEEFQNKKSALEMRVNELTAELDQLRSGIDERGREVTDIRVRALGKKQETESLAREQILLNATLADVISQVEKMSEESQRNTDTLNTSQVSVEDLQTELQRSIHKVKEAEMAVAATREEYEKCQAEVLSAQNNQSQVMHELNQVRGKMGEAQVRLEQCKMREAYLVDQVNERYVLDLKEIAAQYRDVPGEMEQWAIDVEELRDKIKRIGEVNLSAIEEYDEVIQRHKFLSQQHQDLMDAKDNLHKVIDRINRICSRRFKETFEQVNERFQRVFPVLFGGGEAQLLLIENDEVHEPGIDIIARPPGKKMQNVTLLSGGEKALTAVSLIFSIFLVKPSPFCLLDEVDAPLDDANVYRFNDLVKEMAKRSQIILVTHNKHTMKVNNKLYGVTMQEKGVSRMVSVSLADAEKLTV